MPWPGQTDFSEAVQNPAVCFKGTELESGEVSLNPRGLPLMWSGSFACVYSLSVGNQKFAVRCFTREIKDQQSRYEQLSNYLDGVLPPAFVSFEYLENGINLRGDWYPAVKMEWVEGDPLGKFVDSNVNEPDTLRRIARQWRGGNNCQPPGAAHRPQRPTARQRHGPNGRQHPAGGLRRYVPAPVPGATQPGTGAQELPAPAENLGRLR